MGHSSRRRAPAGGLVALVHEGKYWCWVPLRFDDFAVHMFVEEDPNGDRTTNFALQGTGRKKPEGRPPQQLGWPLIDIAYPVRAHATPKRAVFHLK